MSGKRWFALFAAAAALCLRMAPDARADCHEVRGGVILGFTGPIESLTPAMADCAELAFIQALDSGAFLGSKVPVAVRGDSTCIDAAAATAAAERPVTAGRILSPVGGADAAPAMIRIENPHLHFGGIRAVDGVSVAIEEGSITGLIGPNGAGKATAIKAILGMVGLPEDSLLREHLLDSAAYMRLIVMGLVLLVVLRFSPRGIIPERGGR